MSEDILINNINQWSAPKLAEDQTNNGESTLHLDSVD